MNNKGVEVHALCLLSGSVESQLAICLLRDQGVRVRSITFSNPLFDVDAAKTAAIQLNIPHHVEDLTLPLLSVLDRLGEAPGQQERACLRYAIEIQRRAREHMKECGCRFLCTGAILNDRVPWLSTDAFSRVDRSSDCTGHVLRPLSAGALTVTVPEEEGWADRARLPAMTGPEPEELRALAARYQVCDHSVPSVCRAFTEQVFVARVRDLREHEGLHGNKGLRLLQLGRHFRVGKSAKLVVGRNAQENAVIEGMAELYDVVLKAQDARGPTALLPFTATEEEIRRGAAICARYCDTAGDGALQVRVRSSRGTDRVEVQAATHDEVEAFRIDRTRQVTPQEAPVKHTG